MCRDLFIPVKSSLIKRLTGNNKHDFSAAAEKHNWMFPLADSLGAWGSCSGMSSEMRPRASRDRAIGSRIFQERFQPV